MAEDNIAIRLKFLVQNLNVSSSAFADICGISRATFSQLLTGRNKKISDVIIGQIHDAYPNLSILWLLFGEGRMWNGESPEGTNSVSDSDFNDDASAPDNSGREGTVKLPEIASQIPESRTVGGNVFEYSKENGLNSGDSTVNISEKERIKHALEISELQDEITKLKSQIKRIVQVTVYYDDSTFETLYPSRS